MKRWLITSLLLAAVRGEELNVRVYEGAEKGTRMTYSPDFQAKMMSFKSCFGQLETEIDWIEYNSAKAIFYTTEVVGTVRSASSSTATLHLLCTGNRMHSLGFRVIISHRNHHPPTFSSDNYQLYVAIGAEKNTRITTIQVTDNDPVIYNSEFRLSLTSASTALSSPFQLLPDGSLVVTSTLTKEIPYKPIKLQMLAIDFGSPQMYSISNISVIPVTVSAVRDLSVNIATDKYQVIQWELPSYGHADRFQLTMTSSTSDIIYEDFVGGDQTKILTRVPITPDDVITFQVFAVDTTGSTPSEKKTLHLFQNELACEGDCEEGRGVPLCFHGPFGRVEQFEDEQGHHCLCFAGFHGTRCQQVAECSQEKTIGAFGGIDWPQTESNSSLKLRCPYNMIDDQQFVERTCEWQQNRQKAIWRQAKEMDRCKTQSSVLTHLGMLGTFTSNANSVSTLHTVSRFINELMTVPAFSTNTTHAHFDQKIAENVVHIVDILMRMDLDALQGNTSIAKKDMWDSIVEVSRRIPTPFVLTSPEHSLVMKSLLWTSHTDSSDYAMGTSCRINLPKIADERTLRVICMTNSTLFDIVHPNNPILLLESNDVSPDVKKTTRTVRTTIMLKPMDQVDNYTCVFYDEEEGGWSTRGIRRIDFFYHGFVRCETSHMGVFSLLPERLFQADNDSLRDLTHLLPTTTSIICILCSVFLLFTTAAQRNQTVDLAFLFYLFFVFLLHICHFVVIVAPQVGEPFESTTALQLLMQFSLLSLTAALHLVMRSLHEVVLSSSSDASSPTHDIRKEEEEPSCGRPLTVFVLCLLLPSMLTFSSFYFANEREMPDLKTIIEDSSWLHLLNYLSPVLFFLFLIVFYAIWNIYSGTSTKNRNRCPDDHFSAVPSATQASLSAIFMVFFLMCLVVLFAFRYESLSCAVLFSAAQVLYSCSAFIFAACVFRTRYEMEREPHSSCHSLERKRDISRALLQHVDNQSDVPEEPEVYLQVTHSLYDRRPMVSIV